MSRKKETGIPGELQRADNELAVGLSKEKENQVKKSPRNTTHQKRKRTDYIRAIQETQKNPTSKKTSQDLLKKDPAGKNSKATKNHPRL